MISPSADNINKLMKIALEDPIGKRMLKKDWRAFVVSHFALSASQKKSLTTQSGLPPDRVDAIQKAINAVVKDGGAIRVSESVKAPGVMLLAIKSAKDYMFKCSIETKTFKCSVEF
ncbi:hypothetical protein [Sideroxydans sp. CL21]|nr:hypothetical protein [Sideroxydans sp. CL21]